jgi:hypothetical protein
MKKNWISIVLLCLVTVCCNAQTDGYKLYSQLDSVKKSGFYNIEITPSLSAYLKTDYSDLRIVNDSGKWIPHVLRFPAAESSDSLIYENLKVIKKETTGTNTILEIDANNGIIANLILNIRNTVAERLCTISGSDDRKSWFVINDSLLLNPLPNTAGTSNIFKIDFPPNNYKFFRIVIYNNNKSPFDIKDIVQYQITSAYNNPKFKLIQNPPTTIVQKDSNKISYIKIIQQQPYHFDNIYLKISGVKYFSRKTSLYIPYNNSHSFSNPGQLVQSFTISGSSVQFTVPLSNATVFYLLINNEDNLPLKITEVNTTVHNHYITAYLEQGGQYKLIMSNATATLPNYDLDDIKEKTPDTVPFLSAGKIIAIKENNITVKPVKNNQWILWAAIIAALFILLLFTKKMMKEVDKRKQDDSI